MLSKTYFKIFIILFFNLATMFLFIGFSSADVPKFINYQGKLTNKSGTPLNGAYTMTFTIYDAVGTHLWTENQSSVAVNNGIFNVILGSGADGVPDTADDTLVTESVFSDVNRWLGVKVGTDSEMSPRQKLNTTPYAFKANDSAKISGLSLSQVLNEGGERGIVESGNLVNVSGDRAGWSLDSFTTLYTVPAGKVAYIVSFSCRYSWSAGAPPYANIELQVFDGINTRSKLFNGGGTGFMSWSVGDYLGTIAVSQKTLIKLYPGWEIRLTGGSLGLHGNMWSSAQVYELDNP